MYTRQRGLSLIELVMFMVIMGVAAVTVLQLLNISTKASADPVRRKQALLLAEAFMEEVQQARFTFCDPSDLNAATAAELESLPGVGPVMAAAILAWREENGRFTAVEELQEVSGIGPKTFEKLMPLVRV